MKGTIDMAIQTFKRYENKFLLNRRQYELLRGRLDEFMEADEHCREGNKYKICNLYFDNEHNDIIRESVSKPYYKEKLRLRSYGTPQSDETRVFLEMKKKIGGIVNKRRATLTLAQARAYLKDGITPELSDYTSRQVLSEISWYLKTNPVKPAAYISYDRIALFGREDKDFRVTFDTNIQTRRDDLLLESGSYGEQLLPEDVILMEMKISGAVPVWLSRIMSELGIYKRGFSKFGSEYSKLLSENKSAVSPQSGEKIHAGAIEPINLYNNREAV